MEKEIKKEKTRARQGVTGHNVRYVLSVSVFLAVVALLIAYFAFIH